ncbi:MAG: RNA 2',3'-cyclic phosphodiesterase [Actinobacteria bacterium]|nr:RNA 2',3'-cyclic phosphodiesterase [Actinomycetota bacterium]MCI0543177.1 RNA 2',3'-cyclic phosphodiesterase [Actinomycetota bacterium]MCI0679502.1 RNA 2',3'-cyclic phosphodiesterase [Actinomycetota bacterium]
MRRVFAALPLPDEVRQALAERIEPLRLPGRLIPPPNWHVTLRFLGWVDETVYERFLYGLTPVEEMRRFRVTLGRLGAFPNPRRATVLWLGVDKGSETMEALNEVTETAAVDAGLDPEERPFSPHLTLSRIRPPEAVARVVETGIEIGWVCDRVVVYQSRPARGGVVYDPLETLRLRR